MIVVCDVDDTILDLVSEWIKRYNKDYNDDLKKKNITKLDISLFIQNKNNKHHLYQYIEDPSIYDNIQPLKDSLWGINKIKSMGNKVVFATASTKGHTGKKFEWLKKYGYIDNITDYFETHDKSQLGDCIIDDKFDNVITFNGIGILYTQPWNQTIEWSLRANSWKNVVDIIQKMGAYQYESIRN